MRDSRQSVGVPASPSGHSRAEPEEVSVVPTSVPNAVGIARLRAAFEDATARVLDPDRPDGEVRLSGTTVFGLLDAAGQFLAFGAGAVRRQTINEVVSFLREEADAARHAQSNAPIDHPDKLYRMGQKDGLLLAAIAMEARQGGDGETRPHPKDDSAGPQDIAQTVSEGPLSNEENES